MQAVTISLSSSADMGFLDVFRQPDCKQASKVNVNAKKNGFIRGTCVGLEMIARTKALQS